MVKFIRYLINASEGTFSNSFHDFKIFERHYLLSVELNFDKY